MQGADEVSPIEDTLRSLHKSIALLNMCIQRLGAGAGDGPTSVVVVVVVVVVPGSEY